MEKRRIESIDILRGFVMILMALDHVRDYFHKYSFFFDPTDWHQTNVTLYITRTITHVCAPSFVFLSGISAFLAGQNKPKKEQSIFLVKRGLWIIFLELTIINFGWFFNPFFPYQIFQVMWALGFSMICLAGLIHLPWKYILLIGIVIIGGHNTLDDIHISGNSAFAITWGLLFKYKLFTLFNTHCSIAYPAIPWLGTMILGYCLGLFYTNKYNRTERNRVLLYSGLLFIILFVIIRSFNGYGEPYKWIHKETSILTFFTFMKLSKYPPSLDFLLLTLSFALLFLRFSDYPLNFLTKRIAVFGRVPLFFYIVHIYIIHIVALIAAEATGFGWHSMAYLKSWVLLEPSLKGYGFSLLTVIIIWLSVIIAHYPLCKKYDFYKRKNKDKWWLSYL